MQNLKKYFLLSFVFLLAVQGFADGTQIYNTKVDGVVLILGEVV